MRRKTTYYLIALLACLLAGCAPTPRDVKDTADPIPMYPDYTDIVIPYNIAPLNFLLRNEADAIHVFIDGETADLEITCRGKARFPLDEWKKLLEEERGNRLKVTVSARIRGKWLRYPPFHWQVAPEKLDSYLSYRLIEPGYEVWNEIQLHERNTETFEEHVIADNKNTGGSCMNCHIYGNNSGRLSMFHLRGKQGGTILNRNGYLRKLNLRNDSLPAGAVYGDFHPSGKFAVFSSNIIIPAFHSLGSKRLEVYDTTSDLFIADFNKRLLITSPLITRKDRLETFPTFSPDGQWVYFCVAPTPAHPDSVQGIRYSLCRIPFDEKKKEWGNNIQTVWDATVYQASVCHPKISPDGNYLLFTVADYGTFPIWHRETDLHMMDLRTGKIDRLEAVNSDKSDTYHSWSSNSRWFVFASKRDDGLYGKPYFAYVDEAGHAHKPFVLPQKDPEHYDITLKSYNIPELSASELDFDEEDILEVYEEEKAELFK